MMMMMMMMMMMLMLMMMMMIKQLPVCYVTVSQSRLDANRAALPLACVGFDDLPLVAGRGDEI